MGYLLLAKHALPELEPNVPAPQWQLGEEGKRRARLLADQLANYAPRIIVSSREPKAIETAEIVAEKFGLQNRVVEGLHEHERVNIGWLEREELDRRIAEFFARPQELVLGDETANEARTRFSNALAPLIQESATETTIVVAHGTVISLYAAEMLGQSEYKVWKKLDLPSYLVFEASEMRVVEFCERVIEN